MSVVAALKSCRLLLYLIRVSDIVSLAIRVLLNEALHRVGMGSSSRLSVKVLTFAITHYFEIHYIFPSLKILRRLLVHFTLSEISSEIYLMFSYYTRTRQLSSSIVILLQLTFYTCNLFLVL